MASERYIYADVINIIMFVKSYLLFDVLIIVKAILININCI